jgi:nitrogen regulatory protein PII-like uncharacterized protein
MENRDEKILKCAIEIGKSLVNGRYQAGTGAYVFDVDNKDSLKRVKKMYEFAYEVATELVDKGKQNDDNEIYCEDIVLLKTNQGQYEKVLLAQYPDYYANQCGHINDLNGIYFNYYKVLDAHSNFGMKLNGSHVGDVIEIISDSDIKNEILYTVVNHYRTERSRKVFKEDLEAEVKYKLVKEGKKEKAKIKGE